MITSQHILGVIDDISLEDTRAISRLAGISEERIRVAETISYDFYSKALSALSSDADLRSLIFEDYINTWGVDVTPPPPESTRRRPGRGNREESPEYRDTPERGRTSEIPVPGDLSTSNTRMGQLVYDIFQEIASVFGNIVTQMGIAFAEIVQVFKQKTLYSILRAFAFSLKSMLMCFGYLLRAVKRGVFRTLQELYETNFVNDLKNGLTSIDRVISEKPILKLLGGPTMAGFLLMVKLTGLIADQPKYDRAVSAETIARALGGQYSIKDFLISPTAMVIDILALIGLGSYISVHWLASGLYPIAVVLLIIGLKLMGKKPPAPVQRKIQYGPD
jgi:hypothetical protein